MSPLSDPQYSFLGRLLHRIALGHTPIADVTFDLDQLTVQADPADIARQPHVFIAGLARAGTTMLMRRFYATHRYRSLTYRDMPFVLAPNLWRRLSSISRRSIAGVERAHGDDVIIDGDSPESFDEVFWRIFAGRQYIGPDWLQPHEPDQELVDKYVRYVTAILSAPGSRQDRYLCKNNNNILRLGAIRRAFSNALILIPFREPLQHAYSLLRQHVRFSRMQADRPFVLDYMTWLGHHEFGFGHLPFKFDDAAPRHHPTDSLNYWLHLWCEGYSWVARSQTKATQLVCYEDLCTRPETWLQLAKLADIPSAAPSGEVLHMSNRRIDASYDRDLGDRAAALYTRLVGDARERLC